MHVHAEVPQGTELFEIRAHLCQHGAAITDTYAFGFQDGFCPNAPIGDGDFEQKVELPRGTTAGDLDSFKVGTGTVNWTDELGDTHSLTCGPGAPCDLVVQLQITDTTVFFTTVACYSDCPAPDPNGPPAIPVGAAAAAPPAAPAPAADGGSSAAGGKAASGAAAAPASAAPATGAPTSRASGSAKGAASSEIVAASAASSSDPSLSTTARVLAGEAAGLIGGVLIVLIVVRGRRKLAMSEGIA